MTPTTVSYVAIPPTGSLEVTLNLAGTQWAVDGGELQNSGAIVTGLSVGSHTVTFSAESGWTSPASQTVSIVANQTASISGTYVAVPQTGSLDVTLNIAGAQWAVDNGAWQNSGVTLSGLLVGTHTVTFSADSGWVAPGSQTVYIAAKQTTSIAATYVAVSQTGSLEVTLNVSGAQWSVDDGAWQTNGATVSGLLAGSHTVTFSAEAGWTTPASQTVSVAANQTAAVTASYVAIPQTGFLDVTLNVAGAQWAVDNGPWQTSGVVLSGLSVGLHTVTFSAQSGWTNPASQTISILDDQTNSIAGTYGAILQFGSVNVILNVPGAQWAVDGGAWQNSGVTVSGLSVGLHTVTFSAQSGWTPPASEMISIAANQTTSVTAASVNNSPAGMLQVTLNPATAQWAVDNGPWQNSGVTVSGLSVGLHTVTFSAVAGFTTPASQTAYIAVNQTTAIAATYVAISQTGSLAVTLNVAGAQWAVDNGVWQSSGATVTGLSAGSHTITFTAESGWTTPASEAISISANQTTSVTASYVAIPQTGFLAVTLNVAGAQWAVDNGPWQNSGVTVSGLSVGSHTVTFSPESGWTTPSSQTVSIVDNQTNSISGTYAAILQTGSVEVTINVSGAHWAVDGGVWQNGGATVSGLSPGSHTVAFSAESGWTTPASQVISVAANQTTYATATYVDSSFTGSLQVSLNLSTAQWAVDNGAWQNSGVKVSGLSAGAHTVTFIAESGWTTPASQTIYVVANETTSIGATYVAVSQTGSLEVTLNVAGAQWSVDDGALQTNGATVSGLLAGSHTITFSSESGWTAPASEVISIAANQTTNVTASYVAIPQTGFLEVTLNVPGAQWSVDDGAWQTNGATVPGLSVGSHTVNFAAETGWTAPASQTISIVDGQTNSIVATYVAIPQFGSLQVTLNVSGAQWAVDNGAWQNSGATVSALSAGAHTVTYSAASGWIAPASQVISIAGNQTTSLTATYINIALTGSLQVSLNPSTAQWAVDGGAWQNSGTKVSGLLGGSHTVTFSAEPTLATPASQTVYIVANETTSIAGTYVPIPQIGSVEVTLNPAVTQWAVDNGVWQNSGAVVSGLSVGSHTIAFSSLSGWTAPASETISIAAGETNSITATYVAIPQTSSLLVTVQLTDARWSVDGGSWQKNGTKVSGLSPGKHTVTFSVETGWITPASQTISTAPSHTYSIAATYVASKELTQQLAPTPTIADQRKKLTAAVGRTYNGLFYPAGGVTEATSGMLSGLIVGTNGAYSGKILIGGTSLPITGSFDTTGHATQVISRTSDLGGALTLDMALTWDGLLPGIAGTVSGANGGAWVANLFAEPAAANSQSHQHTLLLLPAVGYATITNHLGAATVIGTLADAASFSQHVPVSADGSFPFYAAIGANELIIGWVTNLYSQTPGGEIVWIKGSSMKSVQVALRRGVTAELSSVSGD